MSTTDDQRLRDAKTRLCKYVSTRTDGRRGYDVDDIHSFDLGTEGEGSFLRLSDIKLILAAVSEPAAPVDVRDAFPDQELVDSLLPNLDLASFKHSMDKGDLLYTVEDVAAAVRAALTRHAAGGKA